MVADLRTEDTDKGAERMDDEHIGWAVESSRDGVKWRFLGKGWTLPGERLLVHGASAFLRFRRHDLPPSAWTPPLGRTGDLPMTLLDVDAGTREELWPGEEHIGMPVLLPGGEVGRLLRFEHSPDGQEWTWALEFRGSVADRR
jgi:hypothetical protein